MPVSNRSKYFQSKTPVQLKEYRIVDPAFKPDLRGEFGGVKVTDRGGRWYVRLSPSQAKYWLTQNAVEES